jgi:hypothetical protein
MYLSQFATARIGNVLHCPNALAKLVLRPKKFLNSLNTDSLNSGLIGTSGDHPFSKS